MKHKASIPSLKSIIVFGANSILALPVIRAIGADLPDVNIHTVSYRNKQRIIPELSRYVYRRHYLDPCDGKDELFSTLLSKIKETQADILLPIDEDEVRDISEIKNKLKKHIHLPPLPTSELFDALVYKHNLIDLLKEHQLPFPNTYFVEKTDLQDLASSFFPCLLKPVRGSAGNGIKKVVSRNHLEAIFNNRESKKFILQEIIPGPKYICNLLADKGEIKAFNIQEGLESRNYSFSTAIKFVKDEPIADLVTKLIRKTTYSGLANIDFLLDERDGQAKIIDFNPRFWSSLSGSKSAGVNFTLMTCRAALGESLPSSMNASTHYGDIYYMGRSSFKYLSRKIFQPSKSSANGNNSTDLKERITDPLPEIMRLFA